MAHFIVTRQEIWTQRVEVEADNPEQAQCKVADGDGEVREDARFQTYDGSPETWDVRGE